MGYVVMTVVYVIALLAALLMSEMTKTDTCKTGFKLAASVYQVEHTAREIKAHAERYCEGAK